MIVTSLLPQSARADAGAASAPPDFPDTTHVPEGCYVSTVAYVAKFRAAFPDETAMPLEVRPREYCGPHTVALMTWQGQWWMRDERLGVLGLNQPCATAGVTEALVRRATDAIDGRISAMSKRVRNHLADASPAAGANRDPHAVVMLAAKLLPFTSERFTLKTAEGDFPVLFFRPGPGQIAVYDPRRGTCAARTTSQDNAAIVRAAVAQLGYQASAVRHEGPGANPPQAT